VLLAEARRRADEGAEAREGAAGLDHRAMAFGGDRALAGTNPDGLDRGPHRRIGDPRGGAHAALLGRALDQPERVDQPGDVEPARLGQVRHQLRREPERQPRGPLLEADPRPLLGALLQLLDHGLGGIVQAGPGEAAVAQETHRDLGRGLVVLVASEPGVAHLMRDRHLLHCAGDQRHLARGRYQQDVGREVAPMVEPGQIENVLGRRDQADVEAPLGHAPADGGETALVLGLAERQIIGHRRCSGAGPAARRRSPSPSSRYGRRRPPSSLSWSVCGRSARLQKRSGVIHSTCS
jgi:hypothetical protein